MSGNTGAREKTFKVVQCSLCGGEMRVEITYIPVGQEPDFDKEMIYSGAINWFCIGYGSDFDGEQWLLAVCDNCLHKATPLKKYNYMFPTANEDDEQDAAAWEDAIDKVFQSVSNWQTCGFTHPLTCATEGCREPLAVKRDAHRRPYLVCEKCGYEQRHIPSCCTRFNPAGLDIVSVE